MCKIPTIHYLARSAGLSILKKYILISFQFTVLDMFHNIKGYSKEQSFKNIIISQLLTKYSKNSTIFIMQKQSRQKPKKTLLLLMPRKATSVTECNVQVRKIAVEVRISCQMFPVIVSKSCSGNAKEDGDNDENRSPAKESHWSMVDSVVQK